MTQSKTTGRGRKPDTLTPAALAEKLGCDPRTLRGWRKLDGAPEGHDLAAWLAFRDERGLGRARSAVIAELRAQLLREQIATAKRRNRREAGELLPIEALADTLTRKHHTFAHWLRFELEQNLPPLLIGQEIAVIRRELRDALDRIIAKYNGDLTAEGIAAETIGNPVEAEGEADS